MSDHEKKVDPWAKLNETRLAERRRLIHAANQKYEASRGGGGIGKGPSRVQGDIPFWATEVKVHHGTLLLRFVPGRYLVPRHVAEAYPQYQEGTPMAHQLWIEHRFASVGQYGTEVYDAADVDEKGRCLARVYSRGRKDHTSRLVSLYSVVDLRYWHRTSKTKTLHGAKGSNKTVTDGRWELCEGRECKLCEEGNERIAGRSGFLKLTPAYEASLGRIEEKIGQYCRCGCLDPLEILSVNCGNCGHVFEEAEFDESGDVISPITAMTMLNVYEKHRDCPSCDLPLSPHPLQDTPSAMLVEEMTCRGCGSPERASIYDVDVALVKQGSAPAVFLELDTTRYKGKGFRVIQPGERTMELATMHDFVNELGINLRVQAAKLRISPDDNPFIEKGGGYSRRY